VHSMSEVVTPCCSALTFAPGEPLLSFSCGFLVTKLGLRDDPLTATLEHAILVSTRLGRQCVCANVIR
jgi:hypothetical protein